MEILHVAYTLSSRPTKTTIMAYARPYISHTTSRLSQLENNKAKIASTGQEAATMRTHSYSPTPYAKKGPPSASPPCSHYSCVPFLSSFSSSSSYSKKEDASASAASTLI